MENELAGMKWANVNDLFTSEVKGVHNMHEIEKETSHVNIGIVTHRIRKKKKTRSRETNALPYLLCPRYSDRKWYQLCTLPPNAAIRNDKKESNK